MLAGALPAAAMLFASPGAEAPPEFAILVVEFRGAAKFAGFPKICPGANPSEASENSVCIAELYDARVRIVRRISGPPKVTGWTLRYTAHVLRVQEGARMLVMAYRWESGRLFAPWWDLPDERDEVCLDARHAEHLRIKAEWSRWRERVITGGGGGTYPMRCLRL
ncbi:hypothetical protein [Sphingomonas koreensis]